MKKFLLLMLLCTSAQAQFWKTYNSGPISKGNTNTGTVTGTGTAGVIPQWATSSSLSDGYETLSGGFHIPTTNAVTSLGSSTNGYMRLRIDTGTIATNLPAITTKTVFNAGGVTFTNLDIQLGLTAEAAASKAISIHTVAGTELFGVSVGGNVFVGSAGFQNTGIITEGGLSVGVGAIGAGVSGNQINNYVGSINVNSINSAGFQTKSTGILSFGSGSSIGTPDGAISKISPGVLGIGTGAQGSVAGQLNLAAININAGTTIKKALSATATLDFPSILTGTSADLTITVTGAAVGDAVTLGLPAAPPTGIAWNAFVSSADTVTVRADNITVGSIDPASATYRVVVIGF